MIDKNVVLIGMPGCGKTTIGKMLAQRLDVDFCDIDDYIVQNQGQSISEIFKNGEDYFRKIESKAVEEVSSSCPKVIATGGGVVKDNRNIDVLKEKGIIIFINRPLEHIISDVDTESRPLLSNGKEKLHNLYKERYHLYQQYCDYDVKNDSSLNNVVGKILNKLS